MKNIRKTIMAVVAVMSMAYTLTACNEKAEGDGSSTDKGSDSTAPVTVTEETTVSEETAASEEITAPQESAKPEESTTPKETADVDVTTAVESADNSNAASETPRVGASTQTDPAAFVSSDKAKLIADTAKAQAGKEFKLGGASPEDGFDNSGLIYYVFNKNGVSCPRLIKDIAAAGNKLSYDELKIGDVVFFQYENDNIPHFGGVYLGDGTMAAALNETRPVEIVDITTKYYKDNFMWGVCLR